MVTHSPFKRWTEVEYCLDIFVPPGVPTLKSSKVGSSEEKNFESFSLFMAQTKHLCIDQICTYSLFLFVYISFGHTILDLEFHPFVLFVFL
jgi:hypothetical protein